MSQFIIYVIAILYSIVIQYAMLRYYVVPNPNISLSNPGNPFAFSGAQSIPEPMSRFFSDIRLLLLGLVMSLGFSGCATAQGYSDDAYGDGGSYQTFYDELSPYGQWVNDPDYGYVWVPDAGDDFRPYYSNGYWVNTEYGNTWYSNYAWGWAPFHYGRWTYSPYYGWMWIPGNVWGPAWVSWRSGGGCYGWAPLGPGISVSVAIGGYSVPDYWWVFTPQQYILNPRFQQYTYGPRYNPRYVQQTTIINNTYVYNHNTYISGPRRNDMERAIGRNIPPVAINNTSRPERSQMRGNSLNMYRPAIAENAPRAAERPRNVAPVREPIRSSVDRNQAIQRQPGSAVQRPAQQQAQPWRGNANQELPARPAQQRPQQMQPAQAPQQWNSPARPERVPQPQRPTYERAEPMNRPQEMQRPQRSEQPRPSFDRPQQMDRPQRMEAPRPAPAPQRMERAEPGGNQSRPFRR